MSGDKNVVDFAARAAQERTKRAGYLLEELDGETVKSILEAAYIDCRIGSDGDCVVNDELRLIVSVEPPRELVKLVAVFFATGTREQALEFCHRFNAGMIVARAQLRDAQDEDGDWPVIIDHERLVFEGERLEGRTIVKLVRRFEYVVRNGITRHDTDKLF